MTVGKADYLENIGNLLNDTRKFNKFSIKSDWILDFVANQEKYVDNILKKLVVSNSIYEKTRKSLKPVGTRPARTYGLCKVHKDIIHNFLTFWPFVLAINTPSKSLRSLISNEYMVKDSFGFTEKIVEQDSKFLIESLKSGSLFINIPLEETIEICTNTIFENAGEVEGLTKIELKDLLSFASKESFFYF